MFADVPLALLPTYYVKLRISGTIVCKLTEMMRIGQHADPKSVARNRVAGSNPAISVGDLITETIE